MGGSGRTYPRTPPCEVGTLIAMQKCAKLVKIKWVGVAKHTLIQHPNL